MTGHELSTRSEQARNTAEAEHLAAFAKAWQQGIEDAARLLAHAVTAGADWQPSHGDPLETAVFAALAAKLAAKIGALRLASMRTVAKSLRVRIRSLDAVARQNDLTEPRLREAVGGELHRLTEQAQSENLSAREASTLIQEGIVRVAPARAEMLARTEITALANLASLEAAAGTDVRFKGWISARDPAVRDPHAEADGQIVPIEAQFVVCGGQTCDAPGDPVLSDDCLLNCRCVAPWTTVSGEISTAMRRSYAGLLIRLVTASGKDLSLTVDHPVLTARGWIAAGEIKKGDDLVCHTADNRMAFCPDVDNVPASAEQVFAACDLSAVRRERVPGLMVNLHGEVPVGEVDVVWPTDDLPLKDNSPVGEHLLQLALLLSHREMSGASNSSALGLIAKANPIGVGSSPTLNALTVEKDRDCVALQVETTTEGEDALAVSVGVRDFVGDRGVTTQEREVHRLTASASDPALGEMEMNGCERESDLVRDLLVGHPGLVERDPVVDISRSSYVGHVYNFSSPTGTYDAGGAIVANCTLVYGQTLAELEGLLASAAPSTISAMATASRSARPAARRRPADGVRDDPTATVAVEPITVYSEGAGPSVADPLVGPMAEALTAAARALPFSGVAAVEGVLSDDNTYVPRVLLANSLSWPELPVPLMAQTKTAEGHDGAEIAGRIDRFSRSREKAIRFGGEFTTEFGVDQIVPMVEDKTLRFVSIDLGASEFTLVYRDGLTEVPDDAASMEEMQAGKYALGLKAGKIKAATLVPTPALGGTEIALTASADGTEARLTFPAVLAFGALADEDDQAAELDSRLSAAVGTLAHVTEMAARLDQAERRASDLTTLVETVKDEHRQQTLAQKAETLAMIESLTARIAAGEQISEAMLAAVGQLTERKPRRIEVERDEHGRPTAYLEG